MTTGKHVIFLGAGASFGSGYPLANELRLRISSRAKWQEMLEAFVKQFPQNEETKETVKRVGLEFWDKQASSLNLFRTGGFATLDEFCKLAGEFEFQNEIEGLRRTVRAALGLLNPEREFEKSEYYGFIQSLFKADLQSLREDVTVLTYNYDPYLEFLLHRALEQRWKIRRKPGTAVMSGEDLAKANRHETLLNAVTSGFYSPENPMWLESNFCVLKLHGSIGFYSDEVANAVGPKGWQGMSWNNHPFSPAFSVKRVLDIVAPKLIRVGWDWEAGGLSGGEITVVKNFAEFVKTQMKPVVR